MLAVDMPMLRPSIPITPPSCPKRPGFCNPARRKQLKLHYRPKVQIIHPVKTVKPKVEIETEVFSLNTDEFDYSDQILNFNKLRLKYFFSAWKVAKTKKEEEAKRKKQIPKNTYLKSDDEDSEEDEDSVLFQLAISDNDEDDDDDDKLISTCPQPLSTPTKSNPPPNDFSSPNSPVKVRTAFK